jgi:uncharacterized protein with PIN domain
MKRATFKFHQELIGFLHPSKREEVVEITFRGRQSVKHLIESMRIPHTEIGEIKVNGEKVDFSYLVRDGDSVVVSPVVNSFIDIPKEAFSNGRPRFLLDNHLGKLATYLRMLGFDAAYQNDYQDEELANIAGEGNRILLTRDRGLLMRKIIKYGYCVRAKDPKRQLEEVASRYDLFDSFAPFKRCLSCNSPLQPVSKDVVIDRLLPLTRKYYDEFHLCTGCGKIYWKGSHYERMENFLEGIVN